MNAADENVDWARLLPLAHTARVVAASGKLLALEKPHGIMTHPNKEVDRNYSLLHAAYDPGRECYHWEPTTDGAPGELFLLNRIDSPTSGLVLAALDEATAIQGREAFANGQVQKVYFALVIGRPRPPQGVWSDRLVRQPAHGHGHGHGPGRGHGHGGVRVMPAAASAPRKLAPTNYECLESNANAGAMLSFIRLEPVTGRTHQLRVQCGAHRSPIVGDATYGDFHFNHEFARRSGHKRLFLHSASVRIPGLNFSAKSPLPREFSEAFGKDISAERKG
mgnify:CR=1 FL=1